jgi:hypothetical protein
MCIKSISETSPWGLLRISTSARVQVVFRPRLISSASWKTIRGKGLIGSPRPALARCSTPLRPLSLPVSRCWQWPCSACFLCDVGAGRPSKELLGLTKELLGLIYLVAIRQVGAGALGPQPAPQTIDRCRAIPSGYPERRSCLRSLSALVISVARCRAGYQLGDKPAEAD